MKDVIVYAEHQRGETRKVTFELASEAAKIAAALGGKAHAVVLGPGSAHLAEQLKNYPLETIFLNEDVDIEAFLLDPIVDYLEAAARVAGPSLILIPNTLSGRDVAGRLMVRLDAGVVADVVEVTPDQGAVLCVSPKLGGALITQCALRTADYGVVTVRPNAFAVETGGAGARVEQIASPPPSAIRPQSTVTSRRAPASLRSRRHRLSSRAGEGSAGRNLLKLC